MRDIFRRLHVHVLNRACTVTKKTLFCPVKSTAQAPDNKGSDADAAAVLISGIDLAAG